MKRKHVIATFALSALMGIGVFAGVHANKVKEANAAGGTEETHQIYVAINTATVESTSYSSFNLRVNCNVGDNNTWKQTTLVKTNDTTTFANKTVFSGVYTERWGGVDTMQIQIYDGNTWKEQKVPFGKWTTMDNIKALYKYEEGAWVDSYTPPTPATKYNVDVYVNGVKRGTEEITEGNLPANPSITFGQSFSGWFSDAECTKGNEVHAITSNAPVYCKVTTAENVTFGLDTSKVSTVFTGTLYLYAWDDGGENHAWPGVEIANLNAIELPSTAKAVISKGSSQTVDITELKDGDVLRIKNDGYEYEEKNYYYVEWMSDVDEPAEDGYYIVGTESNWKYEGATKMGAGEGEDKAYLRYEAKANEIFKVRSYIQGVDTWYGENYEVGEEAKVLNIYLNKDNEVYIEPYVEPDVPTQGNGYYIVGTETNWKYAGATKMAVPEIEENDAELLNYTGKVGEKLKVRYYNAEETKDVYGFCKSGELAGIGEVDGDENFVFTAAAAVDIFAKWEEVSENNWQINFYVTAHADRYAVTIHDVLFEGAAKVGVAEQTHTARATAGVDFEYDLPDMNGYVARALYTDANCTTLYEKHALTGNTDLYAKYTRLGNYMTGDATYSGSQALAWQIDGASYLTSDVNDPLNRLEGTVVIPASADEEHPVAVKALQFTGIDEEGKTIWAATTYELGATYTFVELDKDSNFVFKKGGTFAVYINQENKVYFNEGAAAFYTKFITDMNHVCDADGNTNTEALAAKWLEEKAAYDSLSAEEKAAIVAVGIEHGDPSGDDLHKVVASYEYIVKKYGTNVVEDFIWNGSYVPNANYGTIGMTADDTTMTIVVISAIAVISAAGLFFLIRRKRRLVK